MINKIKELRSITDAPIQYCKQALETTNGDIELAKEELKKIGKLSIKTKLPEHGAIGVCNKYDNLFIAIGTCLTDFTSKNDKFIKAVDKAADSYSELRINITDDFLEETVWFKENCRVQLLRFEHNRKSNKIAYYLHHNRRRLSAVTYNGDDEQSAIKIATQIMATNPKYLNMNSISSDIMEQMIRNLINKARSDGKPEKSIDMIVQGQLKKQLSEIVLMNQPLYFDSKKTVEQYCKENNIEIVDMLNIVV